MFVCTVVFDKNKRQCGIVLEDLAGRGLEEEAARGMGGAHGRGMAEWASPGVVRCGKLLGPLGWKIWIARG